MESRAIQPIPRTDDVPGRRPNFVVAWLYRWLFSTIDVDPAWARDVRAASADATVVYVMRSVSYLDFVALDFLLKKFDLPRVRFVTEMGLWVLEPVGSALRKVFAAREPEGPALERALEERHSALLFLRKPQAPTALKRRGEKLQVDHVRVLIERQRRQERPILLMPQVLVWGRQPDRLYKGVVDQIFGPREYPGPVRTFAQLVWNFRDAKLRACEPLDLRALIAAHPDLDDAALVNKVHWALVTRLDRERRVVIGPMAKSPDRLAQEILRNPRVREAAREAAAREKRTPEAVDKQLRDELTRMISRPSALMLSWAWVLLTTVFTRIYEGIEIDQEGLQRVREQARKGPIVLLPSHKSHMDYLLLSYVFYRNGQQVPLIAAGDNLSFWPAGPVLRRWGAFFIRRKFGGARLYTTLVDAYIRKILKEGYAIEFFVEGARSRSGKLSPPKAGLLSMVTEAAEATGLDVAFVPIAIGYEKIVEQRSYVAELQGGEKAREDAGALLKTSRVLAAKYGKAYVQFGEILHATRDGVRGSGSLPPPPPSEAVATAANGSATEAAPLTGRAAKRAMLERMHSRRGAVQALAQRVAYEINRVTPVTPPALVATALLGNRSRGMPRAALLSTIDALVFELDRAGARLASSLVALYSGGRRPYRVDAIDQAINLLSDAGLVVIQGPASDAVYHVPDERRLALDYYKNNLIHFFVPNALVASALLAHNAAGAPVGRAELRERFVWLATALKHEFHLRSDAESEFDAALRKLEAAGAICVREGGAVVAPDGAAALERLVFWARMVRNFLESHRVVVRGLGLLLKGPVPAKDLAKKTLSLGEKMFLAGEITQREAVSKTNLENALQAIRDEGVLTGGDGGTQRLVAPNDTEEALAEREARVAAYL